MDPITVAIDAALLAGAAKGVGAVTEKGIVESYNGLKALIHRKFGQKSDVAEAIKTLEIAPDSPKLKAALQEKVAASKADQDPEILKAAQDLFDNLNGNPLGASYIQQVTGNHNVTNQGGTQTINYGQSNTPNNKPSD